MSTAQTFRKYDFGWNVVAVLFLCTASLMGTSIYGFIMIADSMARTHGWSDMAAGGLVSAMWLVAPLALFSAPVIDRCGPWRLIVGGLLLLSLAFAGLSIATEFWQVYGLRVLMGFGKVAIMTSVPVVVTRWFDLRFGTAISIVWAGGSAGGIVVAPLVEYLDRTAGFHFTALALAGGIATVAAIAALTARAKRHGPGGKELAAAAPKGDESERAGGATDVDRPARVGWIVLGAIIAATAALGCANVAFLALKPQLLASFGIDSRAIALIVGFNAAASMTGALAIGWLTDRFGLAWPGLAVGGFYLAGMTTYLFLTTAPLTAVALLAAMLVGLGGGASEVLWISLLKREANGSHFSVVYGVWYFAIQVGYAVGGFVGGWALTRLGSIGFILIVAIAFSATPLFSTWRSIHWSGWRRNRPPLAAARQNSDPKIL